MRRTPLIRTAELERKARRLRRATREARCERCGEPFVSYHRSHGNWTRFCSRSCSLADGPPTWTKGLGGKARVAKARAAAGVPADAPLDAHGCVCAELICPVCQKPFLVTWGQRLKRKTCSLECAAELKRARGGKQRLGRANPNFKNGKRTGVRDRAGEERWRTALGDRCMVPGCTTPYGGTQPLFLHHICYRQHVRAAGGDIWDPRNGLTVCNRCHAKHHRRTSVIPRSILPAEAVEFAEELLGKDGWELYAARYYRAEETP